MSHSEWDMSHSSGTCPTLSRTCPTQWDSVPLTVGHVPLEWDMSHSEWDMLSHCSGTCYLQVDMSVTVDLLRHFHPTSLHSRLLSCLLPVYFRFCSLLIIEYSMYNSSHADQQEMHIVPTIRHTAYLIYTYY